MKAARRNFPRSAFATRVRAAARCSSPTSMAPARPTTRQCTPDYRRRAARSGCCRSGSGRGRLQASFRQVFTQPGELPLVVLPAPRRAPIERLTHLPDARRLDRVHHPLERQAVLIPVEAAERQQLLDGRPRIAHQRVVVEIQDVRAVKRLPVGHQAPIPDVVMADVHEVERVAHAVIEMQEIDREAVVERIARGVHDLRVRQQRLDEPEMEKIIRALVRDPVSAGEEAPERAGVLGGEHLELGCRRLQQTLGKRREPGPHEIRQEVDLAARRKHLDHAFDEVLVQFAIVCRRTRARARAAVPVRGGVCVERGVVLPAGIEQPAERKTERCLVGIRRSVPCQGNAQSSDQRIVRLRDRLQIGVASERRRVTRLQRQDPFVERKGRRAPTEVLVKVREIEKRRHVVRIDLERRVQFLRRGLVETQVVGINDAAIEMHLLGLADTAIEGFPIGRERLVELTGPPLQQPEVVPGVRQVGPARKHTQIGRFRLGKLARAFKHRRLPQQVAGVVARRHRGRMVPDGTRRTNPYEILMCETLPFRNSPEGPWTRYSCSQSLPCWPLLPGSPRRSRTSGDSSELGDAARHRPHGRTSRLPPDRALQAGEILMTAATVILIVVMLGVLLLCVKPLGLYIANVMEGKAIWPLRIGAPVERLFYRVSGVDAAVEMGWKRYALAPLLFNALGALLLYLLQRLQAWLPLNPQHFANVSPDSSFNTAVSFTTNTNWQGYSGESTMSYLTQMAGLAVQNFLSAATGIAVAIALVRGLARHSARTVGNFWVDLTRCTLYVLLPLSMVLAL